MNIIIDINDFNTDNIFFQDSIKNTVISDSKFIRTIYSNDLFTINIIFIKFIINIQSYEKLYNKYKCIFDVNSNLNIIQKLIDIENNIMNKYYLNKEKEFKITKQLLSGNFKFFINNNDNSNIIKNDNNYIILKISGIWETNNSYGLTYKFITSN